jgi:hypothetical protein
MVQKLIDPRSIHNKLDLSPENLRCKVSEDGEEEEEEEEEEKTVY